jgi:hypothetical protein
MNVRDNTNFLRSKFLLRVDKSLPCEYPGLCRNKCGESEPIEEFVLL